MIRDAGNSHHNSAYEFNNLSSVYFFLHSFFRLLLLKHIIKLPLHEFYHFRFKCKHAQNVIYSVSTYRE